MRKTICAAIVALLTLSAGRAVAQNYSCCDLSSADGACVSQNGACNLPAWGVELALLNSSFPEGTIGYAGWVTAPNPSWVGFCLVAPSPRDPMHEGPTEPLGCVRLSVLPGVSAQMARFSVPQDPRWDGFQWCYGAPLPQGDLEQPTDSCANLNDLLDPTVGPTPVSGSCCGPAQRFGSDDDAGATCEVDLGQEIPGVPTPILQFAADGGLLPYDMAPNPANPSYFGPDPNTCLSGYNEYGNCGAANPGDAPPAPEAMQASMGGGKGGCALAPGAMPDPRACVAGLGTALALVRARRRRRHV